MGVITLPPLGDPRNHPEREGHKETDIQKVCAAACWNVGRVQAELSSQPLSLTQPLLLSPTAHHPTPQLGDPETPSSGDEGEILSAEGPPARELEPSLGEEEVVTPDSQEPLVSSGEEEPLILAEKQESRETPSPTLGSPTLASRPALEAEEVWPSTVAPHPSSVETGTSEATPAEPMPKKKGRFKGLNGRHFQQKESQQGLEGQLKTSAQPPTPEAAGNHVEPPLATGATDTSGSGQSQSPWAILTNEVDVPGAGEWGPRGRWNLSGGLKGPRGGGLRSPLWGLNQGDTQQKELLRDNYNYCC